MTSDPQTLAALREKFADLTASEFRGQTRVVAPPQSLHDVLAALRGAGSTCSSM